MTELVLTDTVCAPIDCGAPSISTFTSPSPIRIGVTLCGAITCALPLSFGQGVP